MMTTQILKTVRERQTGRVVKNTTNVVFNFTNSLPSLNSNGMGFFLPIHNEAGMVNFHQTTKTYQFGKCLLTKNSRQLPGLDATLQKCRTTLDAYNGNGDKAYNDNGIIRDSTKEIIRNKLAIGKNWQPGTLGFTHKNKDLHVNLYGNNLAVANYRHNDDEDARRFLLYI